MDSKPSFRRPRVHAEEDVRVVSLYRSSGLTQAQFAKRQGLRLSTFQQWLYRSRLEGKEPIGVRFHELPVRSLLSQTCLAEIALDSGLALRLRGAAHPIWISSVVNALRQKPG